MTLTIPMGFYFLDSDDAHRVLTEAWGNPPQMTTDGMIFPAQYSPLDEASWGVSVEYEDTGYVSDEDAREIDYDDLMKSMQRSTRAANITREELGYGSIELVGWATSPYYDAQSHTLYWAKDLIFDGMEQHTLNYDLRVLGRRGVLSMNSIAHLEQLSEVEAASDALLTMASFDPGSAYDDFNPSTDKTANYGMAGLIAGGAGAAAIAKKGGLAVLLAFLKKGWVFLLIGVGALIRMLGGLFGRKQA